MTNTSPKDSTNPKDRRQAVPANRLLRVVQHLTALLNLSRELLLNLVLIAAVVGILYIALAGSPTQALKQLQEMLQQLSGM